MDVDLKSKHITDLAKEIIDDIELSKSDAQSILKKATRLSRFVNNDEISRWLGFEMTGYNLTDEISLKYMSKTSRWTDFENRKGYYIPLASIVASIKIDEGKLKQFRIPDVEGQWAAITVNNITDQINKVANTLFTENNIVQKVISLLHKFALNVYYERVFDVLAESIFDNYKKQIDLLIAQNSGDIIEQIPSVIARLSDNDKESISQALTTCRRIIENFANCIFPPRDETITIGGNELSLKADKTLNRINAYVYERTTSDSQRQKIRQNLTNLFGRVSAGVHSDVDAQEARNLFFNVYLILGEILTLKNPS